jgi:hypothetical protein
VPKACLMARLPKPLIGLLLATIVFFAIWMVALKPKSSSGGSQGGLGQYQSAINHAHQAVKTSTRVGHGRHYPRRRWMSSPSSTT